MNILLTGGAGFIGSHIVDALINKGNNVWVIDDLSSGKLENVNPMASFYQLDIGDPAVTHLFKNVKFDYLIHHAAQIDVRHSVKNPVEDARINVMGLLYLLENCRAHNVKGVIFASSGGVVYGEPKSLPVDETRLKDPLSPYGVSKLSSEFYLNYYCKTLGLPYLALRYGNVYGPRQDPHGEAGVVAIFGEKLLKGDVCTIFGDGEQLRDYVYVKDVVSANVRALMLLCEGFNGLGISGDLDDYAFNIGTGSGTSVNCLYDILRNIVGIERNPVYGPKRTGELQKIFLNNARAVKTGDKIPIITGEKIPTP